MRPGTVGRSAYCHTRTADGGFQGLPRGLQVRPALRAARELLLSAVLYIAYTGARVLASDDRRAAIDRARRLLGLEHRLGVDQESHAVQLALTHPSLGLLASYWYSTAHYLVTPLVLVWLYRSRNAHYGRARTALALATFAGLVLFLLLPTAPPRLLPGYVDILASHANAGWWGSDASAPRGLGGLTNALAAFPSLHAGWALWVALAIGSSARSEWARAAGWAHALITAAVVLLTANHWVLDVIGGWVVVLACWAIAHTGKNSVDSPEQGAPTQPQSSR